jgi:hypothetical protein
MACSISAAKPRGTVSITELSKGFKTDMVSARSTHSPLMYIFMAFLTYGEILGKIFLLFHRTDPNR